MVQILHGQRVAREGKLRLGCSAAIFDAERRILLTRRADNGLWCLPGGGMDPGESAAEACEREVWEETGLRVRVTRLIGVYSDPHRLAVYADGNKAHIVALHFEAEVYAGEPGLSAETTEVGFFTQPEAESLEMLDQHYERLCDTLAAQREAFVR